MPSESAWPIVIALCVALLFVLVLLSHYVAAAAFAGLGGARARGMALAGAGAGAAVTAAVVPARPARRELERLVGHGRVRRHRGDALRRAARDVLLPPRAGRALAAARDRRSRRSCCRSSSPAILAATSIPVFLGSRAAAAGLARRAQAFFLVALVVQSALLRHPDPRDGERPGQVHAAAERVRLDLLHAARRGARARRRRDPHERVARASARERADALPPRRRPRDRLLLVRRQPSSASSSPSAWSRPRCETRARATPAQEFMQWFGLLGAPLAWTVQLVARLRRDRGALRAGGARWGVGVDTWEISLMIAAGAVVILAELCCGRRSTSRRATRSYDGPPPVGRRHFFVAASSLGNVLFLVIILLSGHRRRRPHAVPTVVRRAALAAARARARRPPPSAQPPHGVVTRRATAAPALYAANCATCHGAQRRGRAAARHPGRGRRRRHGAVAAERRRRDGRLLPPHRLHAARAARTTSRTAGACSSSERQIRAARPLRRVVRLRPADPAAASGARRASPRGMRLFIDHCAGCHQVVARGGVATGARVPPLDDASAVEIAEAVRSGPYVMPKFTRKAISDRAARLARPLRRVREAPGASRRLEHRLPRPDAGGSRRVADRRGSRSSPPAW